jgi:pilus assembly protein CpaC
MRDNFMMRATLRGAALALALMIALPTATAIAQTAGPASASQTGQVPVQRLLLAQGKSAIIDLPADARDVVVANPEVADAVMRTARRGFLLGQKNGETNVYFLDASGRQILALEVRVARDTSELDSLIQRMAPDARIQAEAVGDSIILSGEVPNAASSDRVLRIAQNYAGGAEKVVNLMSVKTGDQVQLRVRIIEMQRSVIKQLGVNVTASEALNRLLPDDWAVTLATANGFAANGSFLGGTTVDASWAKNLISGAGSEKIQRADTSIQALERVGLARTLAEPTLTATSGESATFLAGGEFPVPVAQEGNRISVGFKPFGVGLGFTPIVLSADRISLKISTEVSEISTAASFRQADTIIRDSAGNITETIRGLSIPGIQTRRAETTLELPSGRSMVMAGLIQQATRQSIEGLPGLKDLPILGNLFRSRDFLSNDTELVIIITPYLVNSTTMDQLQTPGDGFTPATEAQALLMGRLNRVVRPNSSRVPQGRYRAPVGHVLQ